MVEGAMDQVVDDRIPGNRWPVAGKAHQQIDIGGKELRALGCEAIARQFAPGRSHDDVAAIGRWEASDIGTPIGFDQVPSTAGDDRHLLFIAQRLDRILLAAPKKSAQDDAMVAAVQALNVLRGNGQTLAFADKRWSRADGNLSFEDGQAGGVITSLRHDADDKAPAHQTAMIGV
jgi:hypothetical protein